MSEYMFGVIYNKPTAATARKWNDIARREPGGCYVEVNRTENSAPGINNGRYQGWFVCDNRGEPFDSQRAARVLAACGLGNQREEAKC